MLHINERVCEQNRSRMHPSHTSPLVNARAITKRKIENLEEVEDNVQKRNRSCENENVASPTRVVISQRSGDIKVFADEHLFGPTTSSTKQKSPKTTVKEFQIVSIVPQQNKAPSEQVHTKQGNSREKPSRYVFVDGIDEYDIKKIEQHVQNHNKALDRDEHKANDVELKNPSRRLVARKGGFSRNTRNRVEYEDMVHTFQLK